MRITWIDVSIILVYIVALMYMGARLGKSNKTTDDYFLAGRSMSWFPIGLSVIGTMCSAVSFMGGPGWSYTDGMRAYMNNINIPLVIFLATTVFVPFLYNCKVTSCYEYLEKRFDGVTRTATSVGFLFVGVSFLASMIYTPALILNALTGIRMEIIIPVITIVAVVYTLMGGIKAVIWTDVLQMFVLWGGLAVIVVICLKNLGMSFGEAMSIAKDAGKLTALDFSLDWSVNNGVWGTLFGVGICHLQYFTCDQAQVQRLFTAKSMKDLKQSFWLGGLIMNTQYFIFMIVGLMVFVFFGGMAFPSSNEVMVKFITENVPVGLLGIIIAAVFAATMSSIDSLFNAMSTVFVKDVYERWIIKGETTGQTGQDKKSLNVAKLATLVFGVIIGFFCYFLINGTGKSLFVLMGEYSSYVNGSILAMFILGMFFHKCNGKGALVGYLAGIVLTVIGAKLTDMNWAWYNVVGLVTSVVIGYAASLVVGGNHVGGIENYTYRGQKARLLAEGRIMEDGVYLIPGKVEKFAWVLIVYFVLQYVVLAAIGGMF